MRFEGRVVVVTGQGRGYGTGGVEHFTYRPTASGYEEEKLYRGVHPMVGKRLHLWRLGHGRHRDVGAH